MLKEREENKKSKIKRESYKRRGRVKGLGSY